ncbi:hypothetical protein FPQ18DRAFT_307908 [Pyronema domesticum]|nr:hypothetical protein FPQ18DRAFT_307908 [Pyronema domesticum]
MQRKLDMLETFCRQRRLILHIRDKTKSMILGKTAADDAIKLMLRVEPMEQAKTHPFNGFKVSSTKGAWDSRPQLAAKLLTAKKSSSCIMALRRHNLTATPQQLLQLWLTCIEPHLTYSSEITFDANKTTIKALSQLQIDYFLCCLGLHQRSVKEVMLTDFAILPIKERLLYLALKLYNYAIENTSHLAHAALQDSISLHQASAKHSWYSSLISHCSTDGIIIPPDNSPVDLKDVRRHLELHTLQHIQQRTETMSRLAVHLGVPLPWKRKAYTYFEFSLANAIASLRSSTHFINVERLRRMGGTRKVERSARVCNTCPTMIEDERHNLLVCPVFETMRSKWKAKLEENGVPAINEEELLRQFLDPVRKKEVILCMEVFVRDVLKALRKRYYG